MPKPRKATRASSSQEGITDEHRTFIVTQLACYTRIHDIQRALKEQWGVEITKQSIDHYNLDRPRGTKARGIAKKWAELFAATRQAFLEHIEQHVPHAHKAVRIKKLADAADACEQAGDYRDMVYALEAVAKEVGNVHTNRRELTGKDGGPIKYQDVDNMTDEQIDAELEQLLGPARAADVHAAPEREQ